MLGAREAMNPDKTTLDALRIDRTNVPRSRRRVVLVAIGLAAIAVAAGLIAWFNRPKAAVVRTILVQESASGGDKTLLNASGYVTARRQATVSSKVTGKVVETLVEEGMKVETGQMLARIDSSNVEKNLRLAETQLESTRAALGETKANLEQAEREVRRISGLVAEHAASRVELDRAETEVKALKARLDRQTADINIIRMKKIF